MVLRHGDLGRLGGSPEERQLAQPEVQSYGRDAGPTDVGVWGHGPKWFE